MSSFYEAYRDAQEDLTIDPHTNDACAAHFHSAIEAVYVTEGLMCANLDGSLVRVPAGHLLAVSSCMVHTYSTPESSRSLVAIIPLSLVPSLRQIMSDNRFVSPVLPDTDGEYRRLFESLCRHRQNRVLAKGLCYTLLGLVMEQSGMTQTTAMGDNNLTRRVLTYLNEHYAERITASDLSAVFGYSVTRFSHLFNTHIGDSLPSYLNRLRCRNAADMLLAGECSVSEIALNCGFDCIRTFYRSFKSCYGMSPRSFIRAGSAVVHTNSSEP